MRRSQRLRSPLLFCKMVKFEFSPLFAESRNFVTFNWCDCFPANCSFYYFQTWCCLVVTIIMCVIHRKWKWVGFRLRNLFELCLIVHICKVQDYFKVILFLIISVDRGQYWHAFAFIIPCNECYYNHLKNLNCFLNKQNDENKIITRVTLEERC